MDALTRENFPFEQYAVEVGGFDQSQIPEGGFSEEQKSQIYQSAVLGFGEELLKQDQFKGDRGKLFAQQEVLNRFGDEARTILGVPDKVEDESEFISSNAAVEFGQQLNRNGVLDNLTRDKLHQRFAAELTSDKNFFRFEGLREGGGLTRKDIQNSIVERLNAQADEQGSFGDQPLSELSIVEPQSVDQAIPEEERGTALGRSLDNAQSLFGSGLQTFGDLIDSDFLREQGAAIVAQQEIDIAESGYVPKYTGSFRETLNNQGVVASLGWIWEKTQENAVSGALVIGGTAAAAATAPISATLATVIGGTTLTAGAALSVGEVRQELEDKGVYDPNNPELAIGAGLLITAVDRVGAGVIIPKGELIKQFFEQGVVRRVGSKAVTELSTEALQEATVIGTAALQGADYEASEILDRLIDAGVVGGSIGLGSSVAVEGATTANNRLTPQTPSDPENTTDTGTVEQPAEQQAPASPESDAEFQEFVSRIDQINESGILNSPDGREGFERGLQGLGLEPNQYSFVTTEDGSVRFELTPEAERVVEQARIEQLDAPQEPAVEQVVPGKFISQQQLDTLQADLSLVNPSDRSQIEAFDQSVQEAGLTSDQYDVIDGDDGNLILVLDDGVDVTQNPQTGIGVTEQPSRLETNQEINFEGDTATVESVQYAEDGSIENISLSVDGEVETFNPNNPDDVAVIENIEIENGLRPIVAPADALLSIPENSPLKFPSVAKNRANDIPQSKSSNLNASDFVVEAPQPATSIPVENINGRPSFNVSTATTTLANDGYTVLSSTPTTISSYRNGIVYTQKISRNRNVDATVRTTITDLDGVSFTASNPSQQIAQSGEITSPTTQLSPLLKGVRINQTVNATTLIDTASANELATRLGGEVLINDGELFVLDVAGDTLTIANENNNLVILKNDFDQPTGDAVISDGQHLQIIGDNTGEPLNLSLTTARLENDGFKVDSVDRKGNLTTVKLSNADRKVKLTKKGSGKVKIVSNNIQRGTVDSTQELNQLLSLENSDRSVSSNPNGVDHTERQSENRTKYMDSTRIVDEVVQNDQGGLITNEDGVDVQLVLDQNENLQATADNFLSSTGNTSTSDQELINTSAPQSRNWEISQVQEKLEVLPDHIRRLITLSTDKDVVDANGNRVRGYFSLKGRNGPEIVIDARSDRHSLDDVLQTVAHELSHFSTESWLTPGMTDVISTTYDIIAPQANQALSGYIELYNMDIDNLTDHHKYILVHEYLATLNTSLLDLSTTKDFGSLSADQINRLKNEVSGTLNEVPLDLTSDISNDAEGAKKFLENIIRLQAGVLNSNGVRLDYKLNRNGEPQTIELRTTPRGREVTYLNDSQDFAQIRDTARLIIQSKATGPKATAATIKLFYNKHVRGLAGRQFLPDSILRTLDGGLSSFTKRFVSQIRTTENNRILVQSAIDTALGGDLTNVDITISNLDRLNNSGDLNSAIEAELAERVDFNSDISTTYTNRLIDAGYDPEKRSHKKFFKAASDLDDLHYSFDKDQNYNVGAIQQNIARQEALMRSMVEKVESEGLGGNAREVLNQKIIDIRRFGSRFKSEYKHRQYEAHSIEGVRDLEIIRANLNADKSSIDSLDSQASKARSDIDEIKQKMRTGEVSQQAGRQKIAELGKPLDLLYRKELLLIWARRSLLSENGQVAPDESSVLQRAQNEVGRLVNRTHDNTARNTSQKIQMLDGVRGRTLDPELGLDRIYMRFLKPISDPTRIAIGTLEQQNKVIFTLQWAETYAKQLVEMGAAVPIGSITPENWSGSRNIGNGQEGTVLSFIETRDFVQDEMDKMVAVFDNMQTDIVTQAISFAKRNNTVNNVAVWTGNYLSNLGLLGMSGHLAYIGRYLPTKNADGTYDTGEAYQATRDQFAERLTFSVQQNGHINEIVQEMNDNFLSQGGVSSLDATINNNDLLEKTVDWLINSIPKQVPVGENLKIRASQNFKRFNDLIAEGYGLGDDYAKILPYIMNRELAVAKHSDQTSRDNFPQGERGDQLHREAILKKAVPEAIQMTADETFVWSQTPTWMKRLSTYRLNPITNSFIMHPVQWLRIISQLHKVQAQQFQELNRVGWNGQTEYAKLLRSRVLSRGVGLAFTDTSFALTAVGLPALGTLGIQAIQSTAEQLGVLEDEEETFDQQAAMTLTNISTFNGTQYFTPVPGSLDEKGRFIASDWNRMNVVNTLAPLPQRTTDPNFLDAVGQIPSKFLGLDKGGNLVRRLSLLVQSEPENSFGQKITRSEANAEFLTTFGVIPRYVLDSFSNGKAAIELAGSQYRAYYGDGEVSETTDAKNISTLAKSVGVRMKRVDPRVELARLGGELSRDLREKTELRALIKKLRNDDQMSVAEAEGHADSLRLLADAKHDKYNYHVNGLRQWVSSLPENIRPVYTDGKLRSYMLKNVNTGSETRAGKDNVSRILQGQNIFVRDMKSDIDNEIKALRKKISASRSDVITRENSENAIRSLQLIKARL